ncbi:AAA domain-containing protein, partial [Blastocladiella britannica]
VPALDVRWHGVEPPLASEHQIRTAAWGALAHSILTRAVASNSALCRSLHHDPVYLHVLPTLLTCEHDAPRKAAGQAAAQALDAVSALSARSLLFRVLPPGEMARVSIELLDRGAEWSEAGVVFLNVLDRMSTWAQALVDNEPTAASAAAAVRYFGSFYLVGLTIGQAQHATDREFEMFSAVQAQVHDIVTSLLMKLRRLGEPGGLKGTWPSAPAPHSAALGELVVGLTKWARVKDAEIAATVYRVLDDTLKLARTKNIPLTKDAVDRVEKIATDAKRKKSQFDQKKRADLFTYVSWWRDGGAGRLTSSMSELALHPTSISAGAQGVHGRDTRDSSSRKPPKMSLATVAAQAGVILPTAVVDLSTTPPRPPTRTVVVDLSESPTSKKAPPNPLPLPPAPLPPAAVAPPKPYGISLLPPTHAALSTKGAKISSYFQPAVKPRASSPVVELDSSEVESASDDGEDHHAASATVSPTMGTLPGIPIASLAGSAVTAGRQKKVGLQPPKPMLGPPPGKMPKPSASLVPQLAPAPLPSFTKLKSREDVEREEREAKRTRELADEERKAALRAQMAERAAAAAAARPRPGTATSDGRRAMKVIEMPKNALGGRVLDGRMSRKSGLGMDDLQSGKKIHPPLPLPETFERAVVHWDYFASGPVPIYRYDGGSLPTEARKVWPRYNTVNEYYEQFEPLLLLEAWAQMQRSKEEGIGQTVEAEVGDVSMNSLTMEVKLMLPAKTLKEAGIIDMDVIYVSDGKEEAARKRLAAEGRLATLNVPLTPVATAMRPPPPPQAGQRAGGANSSFLQRLGLPATSAQANSAAAAGPALSRPADPSAVSFLAKVNGIVFNKQFAEVTLAVSLKVRGIRPQTMIRVARVFSLITQSREYSALVALPRMPLVEDILQSQRPPARPQVDVDEVLRIRQLHNLNQPQARAVLAAVTSPGITLIQGPPGTGKTKTILGLVGAFLRKTKAVLVCAPSNAAVDEVTKRLLRGVKDDATGANFVPRVVRVGNPDVIHPDARSVALDDLVDEELQRAAAVDNASGSTTEIDAKWKELLGDRTRMLADKDRLEAERSDAQDAGDLERSNKADMELKSLRTRLRGVLAALDAHRAARSENSRALDAARSATRVRLLERAQVVCTTLATAGQDQLTNLARGFDVVIIDEAAQSVELSSLIPLRLGAKQCVLVGDPNQLPPTVISQRAKDSDYDQSLFVRIMRERPENVMMLEIQYRMHPDISTPLFFFLVNQVTHLQKQRLLSIDHLLRRPATQRRLRRHARGAVVLAPVGQLRPHAVL